MCWYVSRARPHRGSPGDVITQWLVVLQSPRCRKAAQQILERVFLRQQTLSPFQSQRLGRSQASVHRLGTGPEAGGTTILEEAFGHPHQITGINWYRRRKGVLLKRTDAAALDEDL